MGSNPTLGIPSHSHPSGPWPNWEGVAPAKRMYRFDSGRLHFHNLLNTRKEVPMSTNLVWQMFINDKWHTISAKEAAICATQLGYPIRLTRAAPVFVTT